MPTHKSPHGGQLENIRHLLNVWRSLSEVCLRRPNILVIKSFRKFCAVQDQFVVSALIQEEICIHDQHGMKRSLSSTGICSEDALVGRARVS